MKKCKLIVAILLSLAMVAVTDEMITNLSEIDMNTAGEKVLKVKYLQTEVTISFRVYDPENLQILDAELATDAYFVAAENVRPEMMLSVTWDNGTTDAVQITDEMIVLGEGTDFTKVGSYTATVTYEGREFAVAFKVLSQAELDAENVAQGKVFRVGSSLYFSTLREAMNSVSETASTIYLLANSTDSSDVTLRLDSFNVTLEGVKQADGTYPTLTYTPGFAVITVYGGNNGYGLTMRNLSFRADNVRSNAAIYLREGASLTLDNVQVTLENNASGMTYGFVRVHNSPASVITVKDSTITAADTYKPTREGGIITPERSTGVKVILENSTLDTSASTATLHIVYIRSIPADATVTVKNSTLKTAEGVAAFIEDGNITVTYEGENTVNGEQK